MSNVMLARSVGAQIALSRFGTKTPSRILVVACGGGNINSLGDVAVSYTNMDLRGFDNSKIENLEKTQFGLAEYMADFDAAIKKSQTKEPVLFGYSHGGYFTTAYAVANPQKIKGLILVEPALFTDSADLEMRAHLAESGGDGVTSIEAMLRYVDPRVGLNHKTVSRTAKSIMSHVQSPRSLAMEFRTRAKNPITERDLTSLHMPVLLIGGTESHVKDMVERAAAFIKHVSCWWIKGASHLNIMDKAYAEELSTLVNLFIARI